MKSLLLLPITLCILAATTSAQTAGTFAPFGTGCSDPNLPAPELSCPVVPNVGKEFTIRVSNLSANVTGLVIVGASETQWLTLALPANLGFLGGPNCTLYASGECLFRCATGTGTVDLKVVIPNQPSFVGFPFFGQFYVPDPGANAAGFAMSNAGRFVIGDM